MLRIVHYACLAAGVFAGVISALIAVGALCGLLDESVRSGVVSALDVVLTFGAVVSGYTSPGDAVGWVFVTCVTIFAAALWGYRRTSRRLANRVLHPYVVDDGGYAAFRCTQCGDRALARVYGGRAPARIAVCTVCGARYAATGALWKILPWTESDAVDSEETCVRARVVAAVPGGAPIVVAGVFLGLAVILVGILCIMFLNMRPPRATLAGAAAGVLVGVPVVVLATRLLPVPTTTVLRCPNCHYDLRGCVEPRCPECGTRFDSPDDRRGN